VIVLHTQISFQLTAQNIVWMLLHVAATNSGHLQAATVLEDTCSVLCNLSTVNGELYTCGIIPQLITYYENCIKIIIQVVY